LGSWRLAETTGDVRASSFLFQRISIVVQRFNSVLLHGGFIIIVTRNELRSERIKMFGAF